MESGVERICDVRCYNYRCSYGTKVNRGSETCKARETSFEDTSLGVKGEGHLLVFTRARVCVCTCVCNGRK